MGDVLTINRTPQDFVADTQHLTTLEVGAYQRICDQIVIRGQDCDPASLPDDDVILSSIAGLTPRQWRTMKPRLCDGPMKVLTAANGRVTQIRTAFEIQQARSRMNGQAAKGRKSGEVRRAKAELKQRFMDQEPRTQLEPKSNTARTQVEPGPNRTMNRSGTSDEGRVTNYERREEPSLQATPSTLEWPLGGVDAMDFLQKVCETIAPNLTPPDDFTVSAWLRDLYPNPYWHASVLCEAQQWLVEEARGTRAFDGLIRRRHAEGWQPEGDPKGYVEFRLSRAGAVLKLIEDARRTA